MGLLLRIGVPAALLVGGFVYLLNVADNVDPQRQEVRVDVPNALTD
jgi:hypothetical protein